MITGNEPAFADPSRGAEQSLDNQSPMSNPSGLTIRQYFAAMAMQGLLSRCDKDKGMDSWSISITRQSVICADLLIEALNKEVK